MRDQPGRHAPSDGEWLLHCDIVHKIRQIHEYMDNCLRDMSSGKLGVSLFIENPHTGKIRKSGYVGNLREVVSSWCKVGSSFA